MFFLIDNIASNTIYIAYHILKTMTDCGLCIAFCALGYNMMRSFYRIRKQSQPSSTTGVSGINNDVSNPESPHHLNSSFNYTSAGHTSANEDDDDGSRQHVHNNSQSQSIAVNNQNDNYAAIPSQAQVGWPIIAAILTIFGIVSNLLAYLPFFNGEFVQAIVLFVDVRQLITAIGCFYMAYCMYFLNQEVCHSIYFIIIFCLCRMF